MKNIEFSSPNIDKDGIPFIRDLNIKIKPNERRVRLKFIYESNQEEIDLSLEYFLDKQLNIRGIEANRNIPLQLNIGISIFNKGLSVQGFINKQKIDSILKLSNLLEFFNIIKQSILN